MNVMNGEVKFDGATEDTGHSILWFTDEQTGGSFTVTPELGETFDAKLADMRSKFNPNRPVFGIQAYSPRVGMLKRIWFAIVEKLRARRKPVSGVKLTTLK